MDAILFFFNLFLFVGAIFAFNHSAKIKTLEKEISKLTKLVEQQARKLRKLEPIANLNPEISDESERPTETNVESKTPAVQPAYLSRKLDQIVEESLDSSPSFSATESAVTESKQNKQSVAKQATQYFDFEALIKGNGLLWLGALVLSIGGIFLAKYSIEAGLLPPEIRVAGGGIFGVILVVAAEFLARNKKRFNIHSPYISAALASGGVITCFAMTLVAFDFYQFIPANAAFGLLAIISLTATWLSLRFGPILAGIGIIGAYAVPALVSTGSNNVFALLLYITFVSVSAIWVAETVKKFWIWWLSCLGHFFWMVSSLFIASKSDFWPIMLFTLVSIYFYVIVSILGWKLNLTMTKALSIKALLMPRKEQIGIILPLIVMVFFFLTHQYSPNLIWANILFALVLCWLPFRHSAFDTWPFYTLLFALFSYQLFPEPQRYEDVTFLFTNGFLFAQIAALFGVVYSAFMIRMFPERPSFLLLLVITPLMLYGLSYATADEQASAFLYPVWSAELLVIALVAAYFTFKVSVPMQKVTLFILANTCITLCMTMLLDASTLTLAIAVQVASMSYLSRKYLVALPDWLYKVALGVVGFRLTLAPWLDSYAGETILGIHWTIVIYPLVMGCIWFARQYQQSETLKAWLTGSFIHVLALLTTTETSYLLVGHYPDFLALSFQESVLLALNWLVLGLIYMWRSRTAHISKKVYLAGGYLLLIATTLAHFQISIVESPFVTNFNVGEWIGLNWLVLLWAIPAIILLASYRYKIIEAPLNKIALVVSGVFLMFYINGVIRGAYHDGVLNVVKPMGQAELYTYSIVWLVLSTLMIYFSQQRQLNRARNIGLGILSLVVLKAFLIDMSNLEGLYRAISFIGLGLCLVGIGWLFQRLINKNATEE